MFFAQIIETVFDKDANASATYSVYNWLYSLIKDCK